MNDYHRPMRERESELAAVKRVHGGKAMQVNDVSTVIHHYIYSGSSISIDHTRTAHMQLNIPQHHLARILYKCT